MEESSNIIFGETGTTPIKTDLYHVIYLYIDFRLTLYTRVRIMLEIHFDSNGMLTEQHCLDSLNLGQA